MTRKSMLKRKISLDRRGMVGFPLRILIYIVIVAIVLPLAWTGAQNYSRSQFEKNLEQELNKLELIIKDVYINGLNNSRVVKLDIPKGLFHEVKWVKIGGTDDAPWSRLSTIRYKPSYKSAQTKVIQSPNIPVTSFSEGETKPYEIGSGEYEIYIECTHDEDLLDGNRFVQVSSR